MSTKMTLRELQKLVKQGEHQFLEFKRKINHPEKVVKEIVAFANSQGGYLLVGVDDDGNIPGLKHAEDEDYSLKKAIEELCFPLINYRSTLVHITTHRAVICYEIATDGRKPHLVKNPENNHPGKAYIRIGDRSVQASREMRKILEWQYASKNIFFKYGEKEQRLLQYLRENDTITLVQFMQLAKLNRYRASSTLILLVCANVIKIIPQEREDIYTLAHSHAEPLST